jgi:predicted TIM-barrel fold metal-dependent hydrolase
MTTSTGVSRAASIRADIGHPVVDGDGHIVEVAPVFVEYLRETVSSAVADRFVQTRHPQSLPAPERHDRWIIEPNLWGSPTKNTLDRATAALPVLYAERMDDLGIDFSILYPSLGLFVYNPIDPEIRDEVVRAYNRFVIDICRSHEDRLCPVATIPMYTPADAIAHLEDAVSIGHKVVCMQGYARRPIAEAERKYGDRGEFAYRLDYFGLDSPYDYDAVWAKCLELKVAPTFHSASGLWAGRSVTNYTNNHIGTLAQAQEGLAKSLFLGGVTRRFPTLNFGFLECGAGWAWSLFTDLVAHYEKRNLEKMADYVDPAKLDIEGLMGYFDQYADSFTREHMDQARGFYQRPLTPLPERDDFWRLEIDDIRQIVDRFIPRFYIGCEADDRSVALAFDTRLNRFGTKIRALFGSDVGHWDVPDVGDVLVEAYELVEDGLITEEDFRAFTFTNPVRLHAGVNPDFFADTVVAQDVALLLEEDDRY